MCIRDRYFVSYYDYYQPEAYVPAQDLYIEKDSSINEEIDRLRHAATSALFARRDVVVVASVSCIYGLGSPDKYNAQVTLLKRGEMTDRDEILRKLVDNQYTRNDATLGRGSFRARGRTACSTSSRTTSSASSTSRTRPCRRSAACSRAT